MTDEPTAQPESGLSGLTWVEYPYPRWVANEDIEDAPYLRSLYEILFGRPEDANPYRRVVRAKRTPPR